MYVEEPDDRELVAVATYSLAVDADLAMSLLRSMSIPCYLQNELSLRTVWAAAVGGLRLVVPASFSEQALEALNSPVSEQEFETEAKSAMSERPPEA